MEGIIIEDEEEGEEDGRILQDGSPGRDTVRVINYSVSFKNLAIVNNE